MPTARLKSLLIRGLLSCVGFAAAGASHAAIYTGHWDPVFGGRFAQLGWTADAVFDVPDSCLASSDGTYATGPRAGGPCSGFTFVSASVSFYDAVRQPQTTLEAFNIGNVETMPGTITIAGNAVAGVSSTGFFDEVLPTSSGAAASIDGGGAYSFNLVMLSDKQAQLYYGPPEGASDDCLVKADSRLCGASAAAAVGVFAPVPEPTTAGLLIVGLAALGVASRRRSGREPVAPRG